MLTPFAVDAPRLQPNSRIRVRRARDVSITDYSWAASPLIFRNYIYSQTTPCLRGALNPNVCGTSENRPELF